MSKKNTHIKKQYYREFGYPFRTYYDNQTLTDIWRVYDEAYRVLDRPLIDLSRYE